MIMKTCFSLLCRLLFSHLWHCWQRLTAAFISSGVFSLGSSDTAAGLQRIWSNVKLSIHMLNFKSHPRSLKYLSMNVVPRAYTSAKKFSWQEGNLVFKKIISDWETPSFLMIWSVTQHRQVIKLTRDKRGQLLTQETISITNDVHSWWRHIFRAFPKYRRTSSPLLSFINHSLPQWRHTVIIYLHFSNQRLSQHTVPQAAGKM